MRTARLPTVLVSVAIDVSISVGDGVVHFEEASSGPHQISLARWGMSGKFLYIEVQSNMGNGHIWTPPPVNRMMDRHDWKHYVPATSLVGGKMARAGMRPLPGPQGFFN